MSSSKTYSKIIFFHLLNDNSGSPTVLKSTVEALDSRRRGDVLYIGSQGRGVLEGSGLQTRRYRYRRSKNRLFTLFSFFASQVFLYRALSNADDVPDDAIIFVNTLLPFGAALWGKRTGRKVIIHVHEVSITPAPLRWFLKSCASKCASQLLYVTQDHLNRIPIKGPPAEVLPNPISPAISTQAAHHTPRRSKSFNVLMLASLRGYKGIEEFMILAQALAHRSDVTFTLVLNAEQTDVDTFVEQHPNAENVLIHARTANPTSFYKEADLVLNLSRVDQWIETFGLTLVEAMAFGIPVIAPPFGGPTEIVTNGQEGYCIDSRKVGELKRAVLHLADDPDLARSMSQAARKRAQHFTFEVYSNKLRSILTKVNDQEQFQ